MEQIMNFFPDKTVSVLGWTIIHSIWQAAVLGIVLLLLLRSIPAKHSRIRYALSLLSLFVLFIISVCTYIIIGESQSYISGAEVTGGLAVSTSFVYDISGMLADKSSSNSQGLISMIPGISNYFSLIVLIWTTGVIAFTLRTAGGIYLTGRYKKRNVHALPAQILDRFKKIRQSLGIRKKIQFLSSADVQVPMLIGYVKPVILIPSSLISGIPVVQLEAVVTHELAHIIRNDYLFNFLQTIIEIIYFYHPVVWLISRQVRIEREHCCDDMCIVNCGNVNTYARALASVSEFASQQPVLSLALAGKKRILYNRIYRLINPQKMKTNRYDKLTAGMLLVALVMIITLSTGSREKALKTTIESAALIDLPGVFTMPGDPDPVTDPGSVPDPSLYPELEPIPDPPAYLEPESIPDLLSYPELEPIPAPAPYPAYGIISIGQDTSIDVKNNKVTKTIRHDDGAKESIEMLIKDGQVEELYIDGEKIPEERFDEYQDVIDGTTDDLIIMKDALQEAREGLEDVDFDQIYQDIQKQTQEMQFITQEEIQKLKQEMQNIHIEMPDINFDSIQHDIQAAMQHIDIDMDKMMVEIEMAMQEAKKACEEIDWEEIKEEISEELETAREEMESIDREMIEHQIQEAMAQLEQIDIQEIQKEMQRAMENIKDSKVDMEQEKKKMDQMIKEIEKLELNNK